MMRFGSPEDLPWIEPWLLDDRGLSPVFTVPTELQMRQVFGIPAVESIEPKLPGNLRTVEDVQVQYRDMAYASGFKALKEDVTKHYPRASWHPFRGYSSRSLALPVDDKSKRDAVIARWKELIELRSKVPISGGENEASLVTPPAEIKN
jgi:hypothetical protein